MQTSLNRLVRAAILEVYIKSRLPDCILRPSSSSFHKQLRFDPGSTSALYYQLFLITYPYCTTRTSILSQPSIYQSAFHLASISSLSHCSPGGSVRGSILYRILCKSYLSLYLPFFLLFFKSHSLRFTN